METVANKTERLVGSGRRWSECRKNEGGRKEKNAGC